MNRFQNTYIECHHDVVKTALKSYYNSEVEILDRN